ETQDGVYKENGRALLSRETYLNIVQTMPDPAPGRPRRRFLQVRGVEDPEMSGLVHQMKLRDGGKWFSQAGVQEINKGGETAIEVVVGDGIARELGADRHPEERAKGKHRDRLDVGETFDVGGRLWIITGVMTSSGSLYDSEIWTKQSQIGPLFGKPNYSTFVVRADPSFRTDQREEWFQEKVKRAEEAYQEAVELKKSEKSAPTPVREKIVRPTNDDAWAAAQLRDFFTNEYKKAQLAPYVETLYFSNLTATNQQFTIGALVLCAIMSLGGIFGVMNTMFAAISQRTKDIGVLRLLGYKRWQILISFLFESMLLALFGGILGCAIGMLADGFTATSIVSGANGGGKSIVLRMTVDFSTLALGMFLALTMGFLGGLIPSVSAMRLTPLEALK
ncbi:MAG: ABC transporter permease, partial [Planctomycetes bacterium]|nr:ABC transporter permease [Planctomycetota bacterium]